MNLFPLLDPIPLPAPVWLFKALHILTLTLHFLAVKMFLGGLFLATVFSFLGAKNPLFRSAAEVLARRLPVVMTYVINLGVPPLLFAQVIYGPALYTSSVLIGAYWLSVVALLMACYWFLYGFSDGVALGRSVWWKGLLAWFLAACISRILSINMTLMINPEVWNGMYSLSPIGGRLPPYDPLLMPRWLFMFAGAGWVTGLWLIWIAGRKTVAAPLNQYLSGLGGRLAAFMILLQAILYNQILSLQPKVVSEGIAANAFIKGDSVAWTVTAVVIFLFALWAAFKKPCNYLTGYLGALIAVVSIASWTILRDAIRDLTLLSKGFDIWHHEQVMTNWQVVGVFFVTLLLGLWALVWLISVMMRAKPVAEGGLS